MLGSLSFFLISKKATNNLSQEDFGNLSILISLCSIYSTFILMGQSSSISQVIFRENKNYGDFYIEFLKGIKIILTIFLFILIGLFLINQIFKQNSSYIIIFTAFMMSINQYLQTVINNINLYVTLLISNLLIFIIVLISLEYKYYFYTYFIILGISYLIASIFLFYKTSMFFKKKQLIPNNMISLSYFDLLRLGFFSTIAALLMFAYQYLDRLMISSFISAKELSSYAVASLFSITFLNLLSAGIIKPYIHDFKKYSKENKIKFISKIIMKLEYISLFLVSTLFICNFYFSDFLVMNFYDQRYDSVSDYLFILAAPAVVSFFASCYSIILAQKSSLNLYLSIFSVFILLGILLNFLLISHIGIRSLGISIFFLSCASLLISYLLLKSKLSSLYFTYKILYLSIALIIIDVFFF